MNIFVVDKDIRKCAEALDDLRLNKMIIETAQLLSTAMRFRGYTGNGIYRSTHLNHPCSVWARETDSNYQWLLSYLGALLVERTNRTNKSHKTIEIWNELYKGIALIPKGDLTPFANCSTYKDHEIFEAYRLTMIDKWNNDKRPPKWTNTTKPSWYP